MKRISCLILGGLLTISLCACEHTIEEPNPVETDTYQNSEEFNELAYKRADHITIDEAKEKVEEFLADYQQTLDVQAEEMRASEGQDEDGQDAVSLTEISYEVVLYKENVQKDDSVCGVLDGNYICLYDPESTFSVFKVVDLYHFGDDVSEAVSRLYENTEFVVNMTTGEVSPLDKTRVDLQNLGYAGEYEGNSGKIMTISEGNDGYIFSFQMEDFEMTGLAVLGSYEQEYIFQSEEGEVTFKFSNDELNVTMEEPDTMSGLMIGKYSRLA